MPWLTLVRPFLPYLLATMAVLGAWLYVGHLRALADEAETQAALLELNLAGQEAARAALHQDRLNAEAAYRARDTRHAVIASTLTQTRAQLDAVHRRPDARPWGDAGVPESVRGLVRGATSPATGDQAHSASRTQ